jgi:micrococcal nuclease
VWIGEELFNGTLVSRGFATVTTFPPNVKYVDELTGAQHEARAAGLGVWSACSA